jgi:hypothetical protein
MDNQKDLIIDVYNAVLQKKGTTLSQNQKNKFLLACEKSIIENPTLDFNDWVTAAKIYLNFIIDFPNLDLGQIGEHLE